MLSSLPPANMDSADDVVFLEDRYYDSCPIFREEVSPNHVGRDQMASLNEIMTRILPEMPESIILSSNGDNFEEVTACKIQQVTMLLNKLFTSPSEN